MDRVGGELRVLVINHRLRDAVCGRRLDHQLHLALLVERREEVDALVDGVAERQEAVVLQDAAQVFGSERFGNVCAFLGCQDLTSVTKGVSLTMPPKLWYTAWLS